MVQIKIAFFLWLSKAKVFLIADEEAETPGVESDLMRVTNQS